MPPSTPHNRDLNGSENNHYREDFVGERLLNYEVIDVKNQLTTNNKKVNNILTIDSREVANMMEIDHYKVLRKLEGSKDRKGYIEILTDSQMGVSDYFIKTSYKDNSGKENTCYLLTKMGCEFLANKFTGEKGILFTAKYVKKFNQMEEKIKQETQYKLPHTYKEALLQLVEQVEKNEKLESQNHLLETENNALSQDVIQWADTSVINALVRKHGANMRNDFGGSWIEFKKNLLYKYSINLNSRITNYLNETGKKTKPKTLSMLRGKEELTMALKTAISMCRDIDVDISDILGKHLSNKEIDMIVNN